MNRRRPGRADSDGHGCRCNPAKKHGCVRGNEDAGSARPCTDFAKEILYRIGARSETTLVAHVFGALTPDVRLEITEYRSRPILIHRVTTAEIRQEERRIPRQRTTNAPGDHSSCGYYALRGPPWAQAKSVLRRDASELRLLRWTSPIDGRAQWNANFDHQRETGCTSFSCIVKGPNGILEIWQH